MTTKEAYCKLLNIRGVFKQLGLTSQYVRDQRNLMKKGKYPSIDLMEERLNLYGVKVRHEKNWQDF
jgi:hypothetical protein